MTFNPEGIRERATRAADRSDVIRRRVERHRAWPNEYTQVVGMSLDDANALSGDVFRALDHIGAQNEEIERLREHLDQALRQWRMYANDARRLETAQMIECAGDSEARLYQDSRQQLEDQDS